MFKQKATSTERETTRNKGQTYNTNEKHSSGMGWQLRSMLGEPFNVKVDENNGGLGEGLTLRNDGSEMS